MLKKYRYFLVAGTIFCFFSVLFGIWWKQKDGFSEKIVTIGIFRWSDLKSFDGNIKGFKDELTKMGFIEGKNIRYLGKPPRETENNKSLMPEISNKNPKKQIFVILQKT